MDVQFRKYRVKPGQMDAFRSAFDQVVAARRVHGFEVEGAWFNEDDGLFAWVVSYGGEGDFEDAVARYYDSPARVAIDPDPSSFLDEAETVMVRPHL